MARANLKRELAALVRARPKAEPAAPAKERPLKKGTVKSLAAQVLRRNVHMLKATAKGVRAALERARVRAAQAKLTQKEIAKNNTEPFTAVWAHDCMRFA